MSRHQLTQHQAPLLIYAPGLIGEGCEIEKIFSEPDLMPNLAGLVGNFYDVIDTDRRGKLYRYLSQGASAETPNRWSLIGCKGFWDSSDASGEVSGESAEGR